MTVSTIVINKVPQNAAPQRKTFMRHLSKLVLSVFLAGCSNAPREAIAAPETTLPERKVELALLLHGNKLFCNSELYDFSENLREDPTSIGLDVLDHTVKKTNYAEGISEIETWKFDAKWYGLNVVGLYKLTAVGGATTGLIIDSSVDKFGLHVPTLYRLFQDQRENVDSPQGGPSVWVDTSREDGTNQVYLRA